MKFCNWDITTKVASAFLLLSLVSVGVVGSVAFFSAREALKQAAFNRLSVTATLKEEEIARWFRDQQRDFFLITQFPDIQRNFKIILDSDISTPAFQTAYKNLSRYLTDITEVKPNLLEVFVLNRSNQVVLSTNPEREGQYEILATVTYFKQVQPGETFDPIFYVSPITGKPAVTLATPLFDEMGNRQGLILAHLNLDRIDQIVREKTGLGKSGETYLVGSLVNEPTFISKDNSSTQGILEAGISSQGIDLAMQGVSGSGLYRNYEGVPVIGVYRWLGDQDIALLVEMSQQEAFTPARQLAGIIVLVSLASVGVLAIGVSWLNRQLQLSREQLENYSHQLEQKAQEASAANHAKSEFLANMSHELRTPLNAILGFTQLMVRDDSISASQVEQLQIINRSGEHLLTLINDVLEMSKIEAGQTKLNENTFDLHHLLDSLEDMLKFKAQSKGLQLIFERHSSVPQYVRTDEGKLRQVLINLLGNAVKFTQVGKVMLRVKIQEPEFSHPSEHQPHSVIPPPSLSCPSTIASIADPSSLPPSYLLQFEVEDTGPGISPAETESLFEPFVQAEAGRRSKQGTGLGLPISRRFVQLMGGTITVNSVVGQGTLFTFTIQAQSADAVKVANQQPDHQVVGLAPGQPNYRILIVEDQWENRQLLVKMLKSVGFELREAENGQDGVALWEAWEPHLIWMDMRMPIMDGYEATRRIKAHPKGRSSIVIALTASAFEEERASVLASGCDDFVRKPFQEYLIFEKMAQHLGVKYCYRHQNQPGTNRSQPDNTTVALPAQDLSPQDLRVMPNEWIIALRQAAIQVDADLILQLLQKIPAQYSRMAKRLSDLTHDFCFDEIIDLTQGNDDA